MTIKASDANELLCDNNTGKTHHVNRSYLLLRPRPIGPGPGVINSARFVVFDTNLHSCAIL